MNISDDLKTEFKLFIKAVPARRLKGTLTELLLIFIRGTLDEDTPFLLHNFAKDGWHLFQLLDQIDKEFDQSELLEEDENEDDII